MSLPPPAGTPPPYPAAATAHAGVLARRSGMPDWLTRYGFSGWMLLAGPVLLAIGVCCSYAAWLVLLDAWT
ncbi:hypothetical protein [Micromonospora sediminicola]|uniref:hypothetical protein n=1 Tax=Micromonospora sediminicola TaxID=946078 RepID=UPI0037B594F0